eukprot:403340862
MAVAENESIAKTRHKLLEFNLQLYHNQSLTQIILHKQMKSNHNHKSKHQSKNIKNHSQSTFQEKKEEEKLLRKALPLDEDVMLEEYDMPEGDVDALMYLKQVRQEAQMTSEIFKSKKYDSYFQKATEGQISKGMMSSQVESLVNEDEQKQDKGQMIIEQIHIESHGHDRDYVKDSLSRLIFKPTEKLLQQYNSQNNNNDKSDQGQNLYQDHEIVVGKQQTHSISAQLWDQKWIDIVLNQRQNLRQQLLQEQSLISKNSRYRDAYQYYEFIQKQNIQSIQNSETQDVNIQNRNLALASELVLQEIFGVISSESENEWDRKQKIPEVDQKLIYGLLCMVDKPLLPDQAADINHLLNILLKHRQNMDEKTLEGQAQLSVLDINICIITEHFGQRFR